MVILSISKLDNKQYVGININIPKYVKFLNNVCESGYLDCGSAELDNFSDFKNYFKMSEYKKFSIRLLPKPFNNPDIVVFQSLYIKEFIPIANELKRLNIPYTIIPRCSMTEAAQQRKRLKKFIGNTLLFSKFIENAKFVHFLTENEKKESAKFKIKNSMVVGNGIELPTNSYSVKHNNGLKLIYVGRIDIYHKGLDVLVKSFVRHKKFFFENNIRLDIYGSDFENNKVKVQQIIDDNSLNEIIKIKDAIFGKDKEKVLLDSDVFIQTSRLEGHPTGVIEAIGYGIPVIVTPGTNVANNVEKYRLGFSVKLDEEDIAEKIVYCLTHKEEFEMISKNELKFAKENYDWSKLTKNIVSKYEEILENKEE